MISNVLDQRKSAQSPPVDGRVETAARRALNGSGYRDLARVRCHAQGGTVVLSGRVASFYMKQLAQAVLLRLEAVAAVVNRLEVDG